MNQDDYNCGMSAKHDSISDRLVWKNGEYIIVTGFTKEEIDLLADRPHYASLAISQGFDRSRVEIGIGDDLEEHS